MNKDLLMLRITYYSGLEILLIQSSISQIFMFVDLWQLQYLIIITSKDLLTHVLVLLPLEIILMFMLKNAVKKKLFEKIRKKQNHTQISHSSKNSFMLKNIWKKSAKTK